MKQVFCKNVLFALLILLLAALGASAQTLDRGAVHGFVYDTSGSAIPGAKVTAIPKQGNVFSLPNVTGPPTKVTYGVHDEISPGSTAFAAQFGVRFQF